MKYNKVGWEDSPSINTPLTAANLNHMDNAIGQLAEEIESMETKTYTAKLLAGQTTLTFSGFSVQANTKLDLWCQDTLIAPLSFKSTSTSVEYTFPAQTKDLIFMLEVR